MNPFKFEVVSLQDVPFRSLAARQEKQLVVLVVDDERVIADTLSIILRQNGFKVLTAYTGEAALEMALQSRPALLLSDVMMGPGMDGAQLAVTLRTTLPECKVMLFSGHAAARDLVERAAAHEFKLLEKPLHPADLLAQIQEMFRADRVAVEA